ncbi:MAG: DUF1853 family protein [Brumimicrobium sp.]
MKTDKNFFKQNTNRYVKDLYWLLFSACPLNSESKLLVNLPLFPDEILKEWKKDSLDYFLDLEKHPNDLIRFVNRPKNNRLGFYAESLLSYFFQTFPKVELLLQNFQLVENKKTLGEIDFIIKWNNRILHLECAVKYYLYNDKSDVLDMSNWVGPNGKDTLARKINKVVNHQLPLLNNKQLTTFNASQEIESYLFLKGSFFMNTNLRCDWLNKSNVGNYYFESELNFDELSDLIELKKPYWMSELDDGHDMGGVEVINKAHILSTVKKRPMLIKELKNKAFFIVANNWPIN